MASPSQSQPSADAQERSPCLQSDLRRGPSEPDHVRRVAVADHYAETRNYAATARALGLSRERVRQIVAAMGDGHKTDGRERYAPEFQKALADLAVREGVTPVARLAGVSHINLRAWIARWHGPSGRLGGGVPLEVRATRNIRIVAALKMIMPGQAA